jgi:hypothetical protein
MAMASMHGALYSLLYCNNSTVALVPVLMSHETLEIRDTRHDKDLAYKYNR